MVISIFPQAQRNYFLDSIFLVLTMAEAAASFSLECRCDLWLGSQGTAWALSSLGWQPGEVEQQQIIPMFAFFMFLCKAFDSQLNSSENPNGKQLKALKHLEILPDLCRFSETL